YDNRQYEWRSRDVQYLHEQADDTEDDQYEEIDDAVSESICSYECQYQYNRIQNMRWRLQYFDQEANEKDIHDDECNISDEQAVDEGPCYIRLVLEKHRAGLQTKRSEEHTSELQSRFALV